MKDSQGSSKRLYRLGTAFAASLVTVGNVSAAVITWDGGGGSGLWSDATNWSGDVLPTALDEVLFNSSFSGNVMAASPVVIGALNISGFAGRLDIAGSFNVSGTTSIAGSTINFLSGSSAVLGHVDIVAGGAFTSLAGGSVLNFRNGVTVNPFGTWRLGGPSDVTFAQGSLVDINLLANVEWRGNGPGQELRLRSSAEGPINQWMIDVDAGSIFGVEFASLSSSAALGTAAPLYAFNSTDSGFNTNWIFPISAPIPEPETYAILLAGLAVLGFATRRTRRSTAVA
jgi:hypothetical protein